MDGIAQRQATNSGKLRRSLPKPALEHTWSWRDRTGPNAPRFDSPRLDRESLAALLFFHYRRTAFGDPFLFSQHKHVAPSRSPVIRFQPMRCSSMGCPYPLDETRLFASSQRSTVARWQPWVWTLSLPWTSSRRARVAVKQRRCGNLTGKYLIIHRVLY